MNVTVKTEDVIKFAQTTMALSCVLVIQDIVYLMMS